MLSAKDYIILDFLKYISEDLKSITLNCNRSLDAIPYRPCQKCAVIISALNVDRQYIEALIKALKSCLESFQESRVQCASVVAIFRIVH